MSASETKDPTDEQAVFEDSAAFVKRMQEMLRGDAPAPNEQMGYLAEQYKAAQAEFETLQKQILTAQESVLRVKGRIDGLAADLKHWDAKVQASAKA